MPRTTGYGNGAGDARDGNRQRTGVGSAVAELVVRVRPSPTLYRAIAQQRAGVIIAGGRGNGVGDAKDGNGQGTERTGAGSSAAELEVVVIARALHRAIAQHFTGVIIAGGRGNGVGDTRDGNGQRAVDGGAVAELSVNIPTPALHRAIAEERASVIVAGGCGHGAGDGRDGTGKELFRVVPLPNWPSPLLPQHCTEPLLSRAQVYW